MEARRERKVVTVLFADLVGFTSHAESMDPEDVEAELSRYHVRVRQELERFGGTVEKFIGDAVMALFGAPVAHEDDAERAVRAALAIRSWAREQDVELRVGVNTGEALVKLGARPEAGEGMAAGDVVNTAARLQTAAPANGVLVGEQTFRATHQVIDYRATEAVDAKGKTEPVPVWEALEARSLVAVDRLHAAALVGRVGELALLTGALDRARQERSVQLVTLVGVPGIGKSRLVYELFQGIDTDPEVISWRHGRCLPYGDGVTFWALGEIVKAQVGILDSDEPETAGLKLRAATGDARIEAHLRPLVGLAAAELGGPDGRAEAFAAWRQFFEGLAEERPLTLVVEDLHWADDNLLDFVDHLVDWAGGVPILVVCTARPELLDRRPAWGGGKPNALTISLSPLSDEETASLVGELLEESLLDAETQGALLARAGGNPLYAEEYARVLVERGEIAELPETVQGIVAARLDLLEPEQKGLLQDAAVLGSTFWAGGLAAVSGLEHRVVEERLHGLARWDFVRRERRTTVADETQYSFLHVLIRDVAYAQLPRVERAERHRRTARWIESLGRPQDHAEMVAHHYLQALELTSAARLDTSELVEPARHALRDAGDRAAALQAVESAERFYDAALRLWPEDDPERADLLYRRAVPVGHHAGGGDPERLAAARDALLGAGDVDRAAEVEMLLAQAFWIQGEREVADEHGDRAETLVARRAPSRERAWVLARQAMRAHMTGDDTRARELASQARAVSEQIGWQEGLCDALSVLGIVRVDSGDIDGVADIERSIELAAAIDAPGIRARATNLLAVAHQLLGDLERAFELRLLAAQEAKRTGSEPLIRWFQGVLVDHHYRRGDWEKALRDANDFLAPLETGGTHGIAFQVFAVRAEIRVAREDLDGAIADAERALEAARADRDVQTLSFALTGCAHVLALAGELERAAALARELLDFLRAGRLHFAVINLPAFASAAVRLGLGGELIDALAAHPESRWTKAVRAYVADDFAAAAELLARAGARPDEAEARLRAAEQLGARNRRAEANEQLQRALAFWRSVGATRYIAEVERLLTANA